MLQTYNSLLISSLKSGKSSDIEYLILVKMTRRNNAQLING